MYAKHPAVKWDHIFECSTIVIATAIRINCFTCGVEQASILPKLFTNFASRLFL